MGLKNLYKNFFPKRAIGLEIVIDSEENTSYYLIELEESKNGIEIIGNEKISELNEIKNFSRSKSTPVYVSIRGKGILRKKHMLNNEGQKENILRLAFPNIQERDFYHMIEEIDNLNYWIVMVRKRVVDEILLSLEELPILTVHLSLDFIHLGKLHSIVKEDKFLIDESDVQVLNGSVVEIKKNTLEGKIYPIGTYELDSIFLPALSIGLNHFGLNNNLLETPIVVENIEKYKNNIVFKIGLNAALFFFLVVLGLNFWVFNNLNEKQKELINSKSLNEGILKKIESLKADNKKSLFFIEKLGLGDNSRKTYYADRLAYTRPKGVYWNVLDINPLSIKNANKEEFNFSSRLIQIEGVVNKNEYLNSWVELLESESWIENINIKNVEQIAKSEASKFSIEIVVL